jgi:hypothetical protein
MKDFSRKSKELWARFVSLCDKYQKVFWVLITLGGGIGIVLYWIVKVWGAEVAFYAACVVNVFLAALLTIIVQLYMELKRRPATVVSNPEPEVPKPDYQNRTEGIYYEFNWKWEWSEGSTDPNPETIEKLAPFCPRPCNTRLNINNGPRQG